MGYADFREKLEQSKSYGDLFDLVKRAVKEVLGVKRYGLMLYLEDLPLRIGAFHQIGSNGIVLNRRLVDAVAGSTKSITETNSFIFTLLLHEYLHSLGYLDEPHVRSLVYRISLDVFGSDHPAVKLALELPLRWMLPEMPAENPEAGLELIKDFERPRDPYIV